MNRDRSTVPAGSSPGRSACTRRPASIDGDRMNPRCSTLRRSPAPLRVHIESDLSSALACLIAQTSRPHNVASSLASSRADIPTHNVASALASLRADIPASQCHLPCLCCLIASRHPDLTRSPTLACLIASSHPDLTRSPAVARLTSLGERTTVSSTVLAIRCGCTSHRDRSPERRLRIRNQKRNSGSRTVSPRGATS